MSIPSFADCLDALQPIVPPANLLAETAALTAVHLIGSELVELESVDVETLTNWIDGRGDAVRVLALSVGLGQERLRTWGQHHFGTATFNRLAKEFASEVVALLDAEHNLVGVLNEQRGRRYSYGDVLVARAGTRGTAARAGAAGRSLEDKLEAIASDLGLKYSTRGRFSGIGGRTAPYDLAILDEHDRPVIVVAAKGFDSTGSKLGDAVREVEDMAQTRLPTQYVYAAVDGIGWKLRQSSLREIHALWVDQKINGVYFGSTLDSFREELVKASFRLELARNSPPTVKDEVTDRLGPTITAALTGDRGAGDDPRLEFALNIFQRIASAEGADFARAWFIGGNPDLGENTPIALIREGSLPQIVDAVENLLEG